MSMRISFEDIRASRAGSIIIIIVVIAAVIGFSFLVAGDRVSSYYLAVGDRSITSYDEFKSILMYSEKPIAVMFKTPTCPTCSAQYPFWVILERSSDVLPIDFYSVTADRDTMKIFIELGINEVPVYIVFRDGVEVGRYVGGFPESPNLTMTMLEWAMSVAFGEGEVEVERGGAFTRISEFISGSSSGVFSVVSVAVSMFVGVIAAFSPCVFPLFIASLSSMSRGGEVHGYGKRALGCSIAVATGVLGVSAGFIVFTSLFSGLQKVLLPLAALVIALAGFMGLLGVPAELGGSIRGKRGFYVFCFLYGLLAVQCNLPLIAGALFLAASSLALGSWASVAALALGMSIPLSLVVYLSGRTGGMLRNIEDKLPMIKRVGYVFMVLAGIYLLYYSSSIL